MALALGASLWLRHFTRGPLETLTAALNRR
jgi:uncharacterized membrane protein YeiB